MLLYFIGLPVCKISLKMYRSSTVKNVSVHNHTVKLLHSYRFCRLNFEY
eukprot:UN21170